MASTLRLLLQVPWDLSLRLRLRWAAPQESYDKDDSACIWLSSCSKAVPGSGRSMETATLSLFGCVWCPSRIGMCLLMYVHTSLSRRQSKCPVLVFAVSSMPGLTCEAQGYLGSQWAI